MATKRRKRATPRPKPRTPSRVKKTKRKRAKGHHQHPELVGLGLVGLRLLPVDRRLLRLERRHGRRVGRRCGAHGHRRGCLRAAARAHGGGRADADAERSRRAAPVPHGDRRLRSRPDAHARQARRLDRRCPRRHPRDAARRDRGRDRRRHRSGRRDPAAHGRLRWRHAAPLRHGGPRHSARCPRRLRRGRAARDHLHGPARAPAGRRGICLPRRRRPGRACSAHPVPHRGVGSTSGRRRAGRAEPLRRHADREGLPPAGPHAPPHRNVERRTGRGQLAGRPVPDAGARRVRRPVEHRRPDRRPARDALRAPARARDEDVQGLGSQGRPLVRARDDRDPHPRADPGQAGGRRRGPEPEPEPGHPRGRLRRPSRRRRARSPSGSARTSPATRSGPTWRACRTS